MTTMIDVTKADLKELVKAAYALSEPQGMGMLHYREGELSDEDAQRIIDRDKNDVFCAVSMDYVHGRACKFNVYREGDKLLINSDWFDHQPHHVEALLKRVGIETDF